MATRPERGLEDRNVQAPRLQAQQQSMIPEQRSEQNNEKKDEMISQTYTDNTSDLEPDTEPTEVKQWHVRDDQSRTFTFEGTRIGFSTTESRHEIRWTEIEIFRTVGGTYVIHTVGVSLVYHKMDEGCASGSVVSAQRLFQAQVRGESEQEPCEVCNPAELDILMKESPNLKLRRETNRHQVKTVNDPKLLGKSLEVMRDGRRYLSAVAREAMREAIANDPTIRNAFNEVIHIP